MNRLFERDGIGERLKRAGLLARLMCGVAALSLAASAAHAQATAAAQPRQTASQIAAAARQTPDGLGDQGFYLEADTVIDNDDAHTVTANGQVEARYQGRTVRAQQLVYNRDTGVVTARGDVTIVNADGTAEFAKEITLDDQFRAGVALGFSSRMGQNIKFAAATAVRRSESVQELNRAIYTPCQLCAKDPNYNPTWSISADRVVQDKTRKLVYYRNAVVRVKGVPVFYAPAFWHPDPTAERASGFLVPKISINKRRGISYEQPYLFALTPSSDLVLSPQINTKVNPLLNGEYRQRFWSGSVDARFGYTYDAAFGTPNGHFERFGGDTSRSYILAKGVFDLTPAWLAGFAAERVTDASFFDRYSIGDVYERRGLFTTDDHRLLSQLFAVRQDDQSYVSISALSFQGIRYTDKLSAVVDANGNVVRTGTGAVFPLVPLDRSFPTVAPLIEARYEPSSRILGGRLRLLGSAVALMRDQPLIKPATDPTLPSTDSRRASVQADWRWNYTTGGGFRIEPFLIGRGDAYSVDLVTSLTAPTQTSKQRVTTRSATVSRGLGTAGADFSWPLYKRTGDTTIVLEPMVQVALSPTVNRDLRIPNEDSQSFEFDETNLFDPNKAPGFDVYDDGRRVNVGGRATFRWSKGREARVLVGRSYRDEVNNTFSVTSGLRGKSSDWIVAASATPVMGLSAYARARFDGDDGTMRRGETGLNLALKNFRGYARYLKNDPNLTGTGLTHYQALAQGIAQEDVQGAGEYFFTKHWGVSADAIAGRTAVAATTSEEWRWRRGDLGLIYQDDCLRAELIYQHEDAIDPRLGDSNTVLIRLSLATLGDAGYRNYDSR